LGAAQVPTPPSPANSRLRVLVGVLGGLLAVAVVFIVVLWPRPAHTPTASDAPRPVPSNSPAPLTPTLTPTPTATAAAEPGTPRTTDCAELYSPAMVAALGDLDLNPEWLDEPGEELRIGPADDDLRNLIEENDSLRCIWTTAEGASDVGVVTAVVWVDANERAEATERFDELGYNCYQERQGLRCVTEVTTTEGTFGESHFLRGGVWLSTQYSNAGPAGYTLDMVDNLWPDD
jgi:hypothetical protein